MDVEFLARRGKELAEREKKEFIKSKGVGLRLDLLDRMIDELNACEELKAIFGDPVSAKLAVYSNGRDLSIVDAGLLKLNEDQKLTFLKKLKEIYENTLAESFENAASVK